MDAIQALHIWTRNNSIHDLVIQSHRNITGSRYPRGWQAKSKSRPTPAFVCKYVGISHNDVTVYPGMLLVRYVMAAECSEKGLDERLGGKDVQRRKEKTTQTLRLYTGGIFALLRYQ